MSDTATVLRFELPLPPSPNRINTAAYAHPMQGVREKNAAKRNAFFRAVEQHTVTSDPPSRVRIDAHFRVHNLRDPDNLTASLKVVLDALRMPREGEDTSWRSGIAPNKGFFAGDEPGRLELGEISQEIDRADPGLELTLTVREGPRERE